MHNRVYSYFVYCYLHIFCTTFKSENKANMLPSPKMDEGRKRVLAIMAGIIVARHLDTADDLFGGPQGSPRTDKMVAAAIQWAERIIKKVDAVVE
jgi:hypothetical protein